MIIKEYGKYIVCCDGCDETLIESVSWREAVESVKQNDWKFEKVDGEWEHYCPACQGDNEEQKELLERILCNRVDQETRGVRS